MIENRKEHRAGLMDWALSLTMMMTVGLSDPGLAQTRNDPIHQVIGEMTTILERQAGRTLPAAAALMLSGHVDVVIRPDSNQVWLVGTDDAIVDVGELRVRERRNNADLMVSWETHGHRVVPPDVLLSLLREGTFGDTHPAYLCQLQVAAGGMLRTAVGAIPAGALIGNGAVTHDGQLLALFAGSGDQLRFMDSDGNDMRLGAAGNPHLPCAMVAAELGGTGPVMAALRAEKLVNLRTALLDGNAALRRTAGYQDRLKRLAADDPAAALRARLSLAECLNTPTLSILCDRLPATFSDESGRTIIPDNEETRQ